MTNYTNIQEALARLPFAEEHEADNLYRIIQDNFRSYTNISGATQPKQVYLIHDNIYFDLATASLFDDGKENPEICYIIVRPNEELTEGACYHALFDTEAQANEYIEAEEL